MADNLYGFRTKSHNKNLADILVVRNHHVFFSFVFNVEHVID